MKYHTESIKAGLKSLEEQEASGPLGEEQMQKKLEFEELQRKIDASEKEENDTKN